MKIIQIKASDLYGKHTSSEQSEQGKFVVIILPKSYLKLRTFVHMYY